MPEAHARLTRTAGAEAGDLTPSRPFSPRSGLAPSTSAGHSFDRVTVGRPSDVGTAALPVQTLEARLDQQRSERSAQALQPPGRGKPLPPRIQAHMERTLGHDFSDVRIHEGPQAESLGALAYTRGTNLHFAPGRYSSKSPEGLRILAHELAHVKQQRLGQVAVPGGPGAPINADPALEDEADAMGQEAVRAPSATEHSQGTSGGQFSFGQVAVTAPPVQRMSTAPSPTESPQERTEPDGPHRGLDVRSSPIHGKGLFAKGGFRPGEVIEVGATARDEGNGQQAWAVAPGARYTNHHDQPNARVANSGGRLLMSADRSIRANEEVTVDYNEVGRLVGDGHLTWRGKTIPSGDEAESFFRNDRS